MIRRFATTLVFLAGLALGGVLVVHAGLKPTASALAAVGWGGLAEICLLQAVSVVLCALAWWRVTERVPVLACLISRWIRDGLSNLVGFIPAVGEGISARALAVFGGGGAGAAAATTIVDVAIEALSQAIYTLAAFVLLFPHLGVAEEPRWTLIVAASIVPVALMFAISRHPASLRLAQRIGAKVGKLFGVEGGSGFSLADAVHAVYRRPGRVAAALGLHLLGWTTGAAQLWLATRAMGVPISPGDALALHGLVWAARSAFFLVPWAAGVQEGGFLLVGAVLHLSPATAIALSLVLRGRDVLLGAPAILFWGVAEMRRRLAGRQAVPPRGAAKAGFH